jgi:SAM-dependent methyltransferase
VSPPRTTEPGALVAEGPNAEQIEYWNETSGPRWTAVAPQIDDQVSPFGVWGMESAKVAGGESVLDVGCGTGQTSLQLAERVGLEGAVLGIDVSSVMLALAHERAVGAKLANVRFVNADAQIHPFEASRFDLVYSRFGAMFFADPGAAFANLRLALKPGGRLALVCWQEIDRNPWMREPLVSLASVIELPAPPEPGAPGPFALADAERVRAILESAGFAHIAFESAESPLAIGGEGTLDDALAFLLEVGPAAAALREKSAEDRRAALAALRHALRRYSTPKGVVMDAAAWIVTARNPG